MKTLKLRTMLMGAALAVALTASMTSPAKADWDDHGHGHGRGHEWRRDDDGPEWRHEEWEEHEHRAYVWHAAHPYYTPGYVYSPPPVVYYPPPPPSGINLILPLHFD